MSTDQNQEAGWLPYFALGLMFVCWGTSFVFMKTTLGEDGFSPMFMNVLRFAIAGTVLFAIARFRGNSLPRKTAEWNRIIVASLLSVLGGNFFLTIALQYINGGIAPVITSLDSSFFILACFFAGERFAKSVWVGLGVGFSGLVVMFWPAIMSFVSDSDQDMSSYGFALFFLFLTAFVWGIGGYWVRHKNFETPILMQTALQYLIGFFGFSILTVFMEDVSVSQIGLRAWGSLLYVALFSTMIGYLSYVYILKRLPAQVIATKSYAMPLISIITGYLVLNETLSGFQIAGALIILAGIGITNMGKNK